MHMCVCFLKKMKWASNQSYHPCIVLKILKLLFIHFFFLEQLFIHFFKTKKTISLPLILFKICFIYINIYNFYYSANFLIIMTYEREEHWNSEIMVFFSRGKRKIDIAHFAWSADTVKVSEKKKKRKRRN